jgi:hypothetical protein
MRRIGVIVALGVLLSMFGGNGNTATAADSGLIVRS